MSSEPRSSDSWSNAGLVFLRQLAAVLRKDLLLEWRNKARSFSVVLFGVVALSLFSFAVGANSAILVPSAPGYLILTLLLSSTLALSESFRIEISDNALEGQLLLPIGPMALFCGKALGNTIFLSSLVLVLAPAAVLLYGLEIEPLGLLQVAGIWTLAAAGLSAPGTLYSAMTSQVHGQDVLLPILHYPLVIPVLLGAVRALDMAINGDPMSQIASWLMLLAGFAVIYWGLGCILFAYAVEE